MARCTEANIEWLNCDCWITKAGARIHCGTKIDVVNEFDWWLSEGVDSPLNMGRLDIACQGTLAVLKASHSFFVRNAEIGLWQWCAFCGPQTFC